jgi:hypothetical protein
MPAIATMENAIPLTKPAEDEVTFSYMDLKLTLIRKHADGKYSFRAFFCPYDDVSGECDNSDENSINVESDDAASFISSRQTLKLAIKNYAKELAKAAREKQLSDKIADPSTPPGELPALQAALDAVIASYTP